MIVCLGTTPVLQRSMVFDRVTVDGVNRATAVYDYASGKSPNVARVLHTLGEDVIATGFAGGDRGAALLRDLDRAGVRNEFILVDAPTRQCITVIDRARGTATELVEEAAPVADAHWHALEVVLERLLADADGLVLSGSLPPGAPQDFYLRCMQRGSSFRGTKTVLDARGPPLHQATHKRGFVAKLNRDELAATVGGTIASHAELLAAARGIMPVGGAVVVTLGAEGAVAVDGHGAWRISVPRVETRSAVGSGDAFAAGLIAGLVRGQGLPDACAWGAACGAANAMTDLAGHLSRGDVERIRPQVRVEPL